VTNPDLFRDALSSARFSAVHFESRDAYAIGEEEEDGYARFLAGGEPDVDPNGDYWRPWVERVRDAVGRGVVMRRARIISEPVSDYIRFEHALTAANIAAGEQVRWLPRRLTAGIAVSAIDFWLFDDDVVILNHFDGNGDWRTVQNKELTTDPAVVKLCKESFEAVWSRAVPHAEYKLA
jgi:hypothetical protein